MVKTDHGPDWVLETVLHMNDLVAVDDNGQEYVYRVQKLEKPSGLTLRVHSAAGLENAQESIRKSISTLMADYKMRKISVNAIGRIQDDQTNGGHQ